MLIIHSAGIETRLLCPASKRYLSRLLVGTTRINPDFITWKQLLKPITPLYPFVFNPFSEGETLTSLIEKIKTWNQLLTADQLKPHILKNLTQHEKEHNESKLKNSLYNRKKKSIVSLGATLIVGVGFFSLLFLLTPIATSSIILASILASATVLFTSCLFILDFRPKIRLKTAQNTEQCKQETEVAPKVAIVATLSETEHNMTGIPSRPGMKKISKQCAHKNSLFNNRLHAPTHFFHFFHFAHKKTPQPESDDREINSLDIATSHLNHELSAVLARLS